MVIGLLTLKLRIAHSQSLKEKRQAIKSLKDRLRRSFNVSVSETADQDTWQASSVSVVAVGTDSTGVNKTLNLVADTAGKDRLVELLRYEMEML